MYLLQEDGHRRLLPRDRGFLVTAEDVGLQLSVEDVVRDRVYRLGDVVSFSATDLGEIVFFYQLLGMRVGAEMHRFVAMLSAELNRQGGPA
jgi:hypothetical protein